MNILNTVTLKYLKKNKMRTIVTIIGIILSTAMFTAVITFIVSLQNFMLTSTAASDGAWHGMAYQVSGETYNEISQSEKLEQVAAVQELGYAQLDTVKNESKPYLFVAGFSEASYQLLPVNLTEGRLPETEDEILLPSHLWEQGGVKHQIGDTLDLKMGKRYSNALEFSQGDSFYRVTDDNGTILEQEQLQIEKSHIYTVVGVYEQPGYESRGAAGYTAITKTTGEIDSQGTYQCYFTMQQPKAVYGFLNANFSGYSTKDNTTYLMYLGVADNNNFYDVLYGLAGILIALILLGSVSLIYNAFSISVSERTKQFGLLASVGATKKQLRKSVSCEALLLGGIGIPLGLLSGVTGIGITLYLMGDLFISNFTVSQVPLSLHVSPLALVVSALIALATVLISSYIPAKRASKVSPIEAIRQTQEVSVNEKQVRTPAWLRKILGLEGMLAGKNFKRNKRRYRSTVLSLALSIVLFISMSSFTLFLTYGVGNVFSDPSFDILGIAKKEQLEDPDSVFQKIQELPVVTQSVLIHSFQSQIEAEDTLLVNLWKGSESIPNSVYILEDDAFRAFAAQQGLNPEDYFREDRPSYFMYNQVNRFDPNQKRYITGDVFRREKQFEINLKVFNGIEEASGEVQYMNQFGNVIGFTEVLPFGVDSIAEGKVVLFLPQSQLKVHFPELADKNTNYYMAFKSSDHKKAYVDIKEIVLNEEVSLTLYDYAENMENDRNTILIINVLSYGFILLISLIAVANVFNTISTNIHLRQRELAMLKSVGMTKKGFRKMMNLECLMYGLKSILYGLPLSIGVTYLIYLVIMRGMDVGFLLPGSNILIAICSVFLVVFVTMGYSMRKIRKQNTVDALKNENL